VALAQRLPSTFIKATLGMPPIDALLFMGGVWENNAFTDAYDFLKSSDQETRFVISYWLYGHQPRQRCYGRGHARHCRRPISTPNPYSDVRFDF